MAFGRYSMSGGRFDEAEGLPLAVLDELKNYRDLVVDVAKRLYKRDHPRRKSLPSGFERQIDLRIAGLKHGCVVVEMTRVQNSAPVQLDFWGDKLDPDVVEEARKLVKETVYRIKAEKDPTAIGDFPPEAVRRLYRLGKSLEENEKITLAEPDDTGRVDVDFEWREIVSKSDKPELLEMSIDGQLIGMVAGVDRFRYKFLIYDTKREISSAVALDQWDVFRPFLDRRSRAKMCSLSVVCKVDDEGNIESIEHTYGIEESLPPKFANRMEELSHLEKGWFDSSNGVLRGAPITASVFKYVQTFLRAVLTRADELTSLVDLVIFPQIEGGIQIEWKNLDYEVDFNSDGSIVAYDFSDSREEDEKNFTDHSDPEDVLNWLIGGVSND